MITPKDLTEFEFWERVPYDRVLEYLKRKGFEFIGDDRDGYLTVWAHRDEPKWGPTLNGASMVPSTLLAKAVRQNMFNSLIKVVSPKFRDYPNRIQETIEDLERFENRFAHEILEDILNA